MITTLVTHPRTTDLSTLARLKVQVNESGSTNDALWQALLTAASERVAERLGWSPARAEVLDRFAGNGWGVQQLSRQPLAKLGAVQYDGTAVSTDDQDVFVESAEAALLARALLWTKTTKPLWTVQYWGGWLLPGDDFSSSQVTFAASDQSATLGAGSWPLLVEGDRVTLSGASQGGNSGTFTVAARDSATKLTFEAGSGIVDESPGATVSIAVRNLPEDVERATIVLAHQAFHSRSLQVKKKEVGPLKLTYADVAMGGSPPEADHLLSRRARVSV